jgi:hypothetical protein
MAPAGGMQPKRQRTYTAPLTSSCLTSSRPCSAPRICAAQRDSSRFATTACAASNSDNTQADSPSTSQQKSSSDGLTYTYHSDGHDKATIEDVFGGADASKLAPGSAPWATGWQMNERNLQWNDDLARRLLVVRAGRALRLVALPPREQQLTALPVRLRERSTRVVCSALC